MRAKRKYSQVSGKLLKSFFSSGLQAISIQVLGVIFLGIVSYYLSEEQFGIISWANAVAIFITTVLGFGLEQIVVRRIAASKTSDWAAAAFLFHAFVGSLLGVAAVFLFSNLFSGQNEGMPYLPLFFVAQAFLFLVVPLKQFLNAKHIFTPYGITAIVSNLLKIALLYFLLKNNTLSITTVSYVLIVSGSIEFISMLVYVLNKTDLKLRFRKKAYYKLIKEATPQYISAIFDSTLSRLDWILLGIIGTFAATGGYSFAYRAYELARLPIVIIAPVILNIFARLLVGGGKLGDDKQDLVKQIFAVQMYLAMLIPLAFNFIWSPVLDWAFDGKYGSSNSFEFLVLSVCIPIHFFINLLWTLSFSAKKYRKISTITIITAISNLVLNLILMPKYGGAGAAIAYLVTTCIQATLYYTLVYKQIMHIPVFTLLLFMLLATAIYAGLEASGLDTIWKLIIGVIVYLIAAPLTGRVTKKNFETLIAHVKK